MRKFILAFTALLSLGVAVAYGNYTATQGTGTTFGSIVVSTVHYAQMMLCDLTTPSQCASVSAGGAVKVDASGAAVPVTGTFFQATQPVSGSVTDVAATTGGASSSYLQPTASDNHANIKNGAGTVYSVHTSNNSATKNYLRLYDAGTGFNGCNSATGLIFGMEIPPSDGGFSVMLGGSKGLAFTTGLSICVTSGYGSTDTTNATATAIMSNVLYK